MSLDGILPLYKPAGLTSHDCVLRVRRALGIRRVGHGGTLDPEVDGVLPLLIGRATRLAEYLLDRPKAYEGEVVFGVATDTQDQSGTVVAEEAVSLTPDAVAAAMAQFQGEIEQVPPMHSAVKVGGVPLYKLARAGKTVDRQARRVTIYELRLLDGDWTPPHPRARFFVRCSKGTYVRTLCVDIGKALGVPAHMARLPRVQRGPYALADCVTLEQVEEAAAAGTVAALLRPMEEAVAHLPRVDVREAEAKAVRHGRGIDARARNLSPGLVRVHDARGRLLAIHRVEAGKRFTVPHKVLAAGGEEA